MSGPIEWIRHALSAPRRRRERREAAWREVAERRDGTFTPDRTTFWRFRPPELTAPVGDAAVFVDVYAVQVNNTRSLYTRYRARYAIGFGPRMKVYRAGFSGALGTMLGFEDVEIGEPRFDDAFIVRTADVEATRRAWTPRAREAFLGPLDREGRVQTTREEVSYIRSGIDEDPAVVDAGVTLVGDLASYGREWLSAMESVPEARWVGATGPWDDRTIPSAKLEVRGHPVRLYPAVYGAGVVARASCPVGRALEVFDASVDDAGRLGAEVPEGLLGPSSAPLLAQIGPATLSCDSRTVRVTLAIDAGTAALHDAAQLAAHLALGDPRTGTFR